MVTTSFQSDARNTRLSLRYAKIVDIYFILRTCFYIKFIFISFIPFNIVLSGYYEDRNPADTTSQVMGFERRRLLLAESKAYTVYAPICDSIFLQERWLLPHSPLSLRFVLNSNELFVQSGNDAKLKYKYEVLDAKLITTHVKVASSTKLHIEKTLASNTLARYHFRKRERERERERE